MGAILPVYPLDIDKPDVCLVDQGGSLQRVARGFLPHVPRSNPMQILVNQLEQPVLRSRIAIAPGGKNRCYLLGYQS